MGHWGNGRGWKLTPVKDARLLVNGLGSEVGRDEPR